MGPVVVSSEDLPAGFDDRARFQLWRDRYMTGHGQLELSRSPDRPFMLRFAFSWFGELGLGQFHGTFDRVTRSAGRVRAATADTYCLVVNRQPRAMTLRFRDKEITLGPGSATLLIDSEAADLRGPPENSLFFIPIPRDRLTERISDAEDIAGRLLDRTSPPVSHLGRYLEIVAQPESFEAAPELAAHVGSTLIDLTTLALGATVDAALSGRRSARLHEALVLIRDGFADPAFSARRVASRLRVSPRTVQDLLHETGRSFTARVLELRLQRARAMLADPRHDRLTISNIALACGFSEVSYFNRRFRGRFGDTPTAHRSRLAGPPYSTP